MCAVRRAHVLALCGGAALLLLLLARLPPAPPRAPPRRPQPTRLRPHRPGTTPAPAPAAAHRNATAPPPPPPAPTSAAPPPVPPAHPPGVVLTRDVYVSGHERPHPELCPSLGARVSVLILVTSAPGHARARDAVRLTWGHYGARADVALGFVLGAPPEALRGDIAREDALYGDLIVGRSVDSYSNLTLKTLSMLEWAGAYCPRAPRILKTDDDMFINVPRLLSFARHPSRANASRTIWGKVLRRALPKRQPASKYYLSAAQYAPRLLPDFATGPAYLVTADAARLLAAAAGSQPFLRLEDVFVTGVLAARVGVRRLHAAEFANRRVAPHPCAVHRAIAVHMVRYHEQFDLWRKLLDGRTKCAS